MCYIMMILTISTVKVCDDLVIVLLVIRWSLMSGRSGWTKACSVIRKGVKVRLFLGTLRMVFMTVLQNKQATAIEVYGDLSEMVEGLVDIQGWPGFILTNIDPKEDDSFVEL